MLGINSSADHRKPFHSHKKLRARQSLPSIMAAQRDPSRCRLLLPVLSAILALSSYLSAHGQWWLLHLQVSCSLEDRGRGVSEKKKIFFFLSFYTGMEDHPNCFYLHLTDHLHNKESEIRLVAFTASMIQLSEREQQWKLGAAGQVLQTQK